jgi:O-antigen/teichoic acid export membrane protein
VGPAPLGPTEHALVAFRNAFQLGGALVFSWVVALGIRVLLPRHLGPAAFGFLNFADAFTVTAFVLGAFGVDTYLRKEVPTRPEVATDVYGGILLLRAAAALVLFAGIALVMRLTSRPPVVVQLMFLFGLGRLFASVSDTIGAVLHARGRVDGLSLVNAGSKLLWGFGILVGIATGHALMGVGVAFAVSEGAKACVLQVVARRHAGLRVKLDLAATRAAVAASLPYYVNLIAITAYGRIDVTVLSFTITDEQELGWYGAGATLAGLCLLATPVIGWVLLPLLAKAAAQGRAALRSTVARSMEVVLIAAIPTSLFLVLGADLWVRTIFGPAFAPAAVPLRILGSMFVLTYVTTVSGTCLTVLGRGWLVTGVSTCGLLLTVCLNLLLVGLARGHLAHAPGAAGAAAALAMLISELFVTITMTVSLGAMAFDRRSLGFLLRTAAAVAAVVVLDRLAVPLGSRRIALDLVAYAALMLALRAVRWREMLQFCRAGLRRAGASGDREAA